MSGSHEVDIDHHVKIYMRVFAALAVLTVITVVVAKLHLSVAGAVVLALFIATVKASLVACYFMHLISEKKLIYAVMTLTVLFFFFELLIPTLSESNNIHAGPSVAAESSSHH